MNSNRLLAVLAVAALLVTAGCLGGVGDLGDGDGEDATTESTDEAAALLEAAADAQSTTTGVHGVQTTTIDDGESVTETTAEIWLRAPDAFRYELREADEDQAADTVVANASTMWTYDADANEATRLDYGDDLGFGEGEAEADDFGFDEIAGDEATDGLDEIGDEFAATWLANATATIEGTETVAGRETTVLEVSPPDDEYVESMTLWVDAETTYPLKERTTTSFGGETTVTTEFESVEFDAAIDDDRFTFDPPADAEVIDFDEAFDDALDGLTGFESYESVTEVDAAVSMDLPDPDVPEGYAFDDAYVADAVGPTTVTLSYADDQGGFVTVDVTEGEVESVLGGAETVQIGDVEATVYGRDDAYTSVEWTQDDRSYAVGGGYGVDADELLAVAESIVD